MLRGEMLLKSGIRMAALIRRVSEFIKHLANQNSRLHGVIALLLWSPVCTRSCRTPFVDRGLSKPDREVAAPAQGIVVLGPVGHLAFWFGELVAAILAVVVGHLLFLSMKSIRIMPFRQNGDRLPIYKTTPSKSQQMRSDPRSAHLLLQVRVRVVDSLLRDDFARWYANFPSNMVTFAQIA